MKASPRLAWSLAACAALSALALHGCTLDSKGYLSGLATGAGGAGAGTGAANGGGGVCEPGETEPCYAGPKGTADVGSCRSGAMTCSDDGAGFGACAGEILPRFDDCATPNTDEDCDGTAAEACSGDHIWSKRAGLVGDQIGSGIAVDRAGNVLAAGEFNGIFALGSLTLTSADAAPSYDAFLVKLSPSGELLWGKQIGGADGAQLGVEVASDSAGNAILLCTFTGSVDLGGGPLVSEGEWDIAVAKLAPNGDHLWSKRFGDALTQFAYDIDVDGADSILLSGHFDGSLDFGGGALVSQGGGDLFLAKLDSDGNHVFSLRAGDAGFQIARAVTADREGNVLVTGDFNGALDLGGPAVATKDSLDMFVAKLNTQGAVLWTKIFGGPGDQIGWSVAAGASGEAFATGVLNGNADFGGGDLASAGLGDVLVLKLDASGGHLFSQRFGDLSDQQGHNIAVDAAGNVAVSGFFRGQISFGGPVFSNPGDQDIFLAKLTPAGAPLWSKAFAGAGDQVAYGVTFDADANVLTTGYMQGTVDFGGSPLPSQGSGDAFFVKLAP